MRARGILDHSLRERRAEVAGQHSGIEGEQAMLLIRHDHEKHAAACPIGDFQCLCAVSPGLLEVGGRQTKKLKYMDVGNRREARYVVFDAHWSDLRRGVFVHGQGLIQCVSESLRFKEKGLARRTLGIEICVDRLW